MPNRPGWLRSAVAHRGLHDGNRALPENSLPAFAAAAAAGTPIELDVRLSADGEAVVHHDATLDRLTGVAARVADLTTAELATCRLLGTEAAIPTLAAALEEVAGRVPVLVEVKPLPRGNARLVRRVAAVLAGYDGPTALHSFHPGVVGWFARRCPDLPRGQAAGTGQGPVVLQRVLDAMWSNSWTEPDYVVFSVARLEDRRLQLLRRDGMPVLAYTVRSGSEQRRARRLADGYFYESWDATDPVEDVPRPSS